MVRVRRGEKVNSRSSKDKTDMHTPLSQLIKGAYIESSVHHKKFAWKESDPLRIIVWKKEKPVLRLKVRYQDKKVK